MTNANVQRTSVIAAAVSTALMSATVQAQEARTEEQRPLLEEIKVTADRVDSFGAGILQAGTFRGARVLDTPLTVSVIPQDLLDAQQAKSLLDALRNTAGVTTAAINSAIYNNLAIRGIPVENRGNYRLNGSLPIVNLIDLPLENKTRVEALKGASALYYGFTTPAGIINLTTKRPAENPVTDVTLFGNSHGSIGAHLDLSRRAETWGVRVNVAANTVELGIDNTDGDRRFASIAFDWQPTETVSVETDAEYIYKTVSEPTTIRAVPAGPGVRTPLPPLLDPELNRGAEWLYGEGYEYNLFGRVSWRFAENWSWSVDGGVSKLTRDRRFSLFRDYDLTTGAGTVNVELANDNAYKNVALRTEIAGGFETGPLRHELLIGLSANDRDTRNPALPTVNYAQNYFNPVPLAPETPLPPSVIPNPSTIEDRGIYVFDRIDYNGFVQLLLGLRYTDYSDVSRTTSYEVDDTSYSVGLVVKPRKWLSLYTTYIEGLEAGGIAPGTAVNAGESVSPRVTEQVEVGVKLEINDRLLLTLAYFDISQPLNFVDPLTSVFGDFGDSSYDGFEFSASGEITDRLSIYASAMTLDAIASKPANPAQTGFRIQNTPEFTASLFLEYDVAAINGLSLNAGVFHVGDRAVNANNNAFVDAYTLVDIGGRYQFEWAGKPTTVRLTAQNLLDEKYWEATGSTLLGQGLPPVVKLSVTTQF